GLLKTEQFLIPQCSCRQDKEGRSLLMMDMMSTPTLERFHHRIYPLDTSNIKTSSIKTLWRSLEPQMSYSACLQRETAKCLESWQKSDPLMGLKGTAAYLITLSRLRNTSECSS